MHEDLDDSKLDKENHHNTNNKWDARIYNNNGECGCVDNKDP